MIPRITSPKKKAKNIDTQEREIPDVLTISETGKKREKASETLPNQLCMNPKKQKTDFALDSKIVQLPQKTLPSMSEELRIYPCDSLRGVFVQKSS